MSTESLENLIASARLGEGLNTIKQQLCVLQDLVQNTASITEVDEEVGLWRDRATKSHQVLSM